MAGRVGLTCSGTLLAYVPPSGSEGSSLLLQLDPWWDGNTSLELDTMLKLSAPQKEMCTQRGRRRRRQVPMRALQSPKSWVSLFCFSTYHVFSNARGCCSRLFFLSSSCVGGEIFPSTDMSQRRRKPGKLLEMFT
ncbi:hypothetical protein T439DRAFT_107403 [Meredithblackwellia eburnea MCA 4105]